MYDAKTAPSHSLLTSLLSKESRRRKRRERITDFVTDLLIGCVTALISGFSLMLAVGIARGEWLPNLPTIGYWWSVALVALLRGTFSPVKSSKKEN